MLLQALGTCPSCLASSLIPVSHPWGHFPGTRTFLATLLVTLSAAFSPGQSPVGMPTRLHSSFLPPSPGSHLLVLKAESGPLFHNPYRAFQS